MSVQDLVGLCFLMKFELLWVCSGPARDLLWVCLIGVSSWGSVYALKREAEPSLILPVTCKSRSFIIPIIHVERFSHVRNANKLNRKWRVFIIYWYQWRQKIYIYIYILPALTPMKLNIYEHQNYTCIS